MKLFAFVLAAFLVGCAAAPKKEVKLSLPVDPVDDGSTYVESEPEEKYPMIPQSYGANKGVERDKDQLKKEREEEVWTPTTRSKKLEGVK